MGTSRQHDHEAAHAALEAIVASDRPAKLRSQVRAQLLAHDVPLDALDVVDESFQEACVRASSQTVVQTQGELYVWLRTTTFRRAIELAEKRRAERLVDWTDEQYEIASSRHQLSGAPPDLELAEEHRPESRRRADEDLARLRDVVVEALDDRRRSVLALHSRGRKRPEIAKHLGLTVRTVKADLERIRATSRSELVRLVGGGCNEGTDLVSRLAFGLADDREAVRARLHLAGCPSCGAFFEHLEVWREKAAAALPLPAASAAHDHALERTLHHAADLIATAKHHVLGTATQAKQQAMATYYRAVDPTPLAGARPGATLTVAATCLGLAGGATGYCLDNGLNPIHTLSGIVRLQPSEPPQAERTESTTDPASPPPEATAPTSSVPTPSPTPVQPVPATQPTSNSTTTSVEPPPPPPEEEQFDPAAAAAAESSQQQQPAPTTEAPAKAAKTGVGEFLDGP